MKTKKVKAVIYIRYSSHRQAESFSIEYQVAECTKYIEANDYELVEIYIDEAKSGKKTAGRDRFDKMIHDASQDKFNKVIVFSFSRSFRNTRDALNYNHELMEKYDIMIESVIERIDMSDPHGKFSGTNLFAMHELQADIIAAHVKSGMYFAAQQGYYLGGTVPLGYELYGTGEMSRGKERRRYRPSESEAPIIKEIFDLYADGFSLEFIQTTMKNKGIKGRQGKIIGIQTITGILRNKFYIGTRVYNMKGYDTLVLENAITPIIDLETWHKVQARHKENKRVEPRRTKRLYALTGKITCAKCGAHMFGMHQGYRDTKRDVYSYYVCSNKKTRKTCNALSLRKEHIEEYCLKQIKAHILNEEAMRSIAQQIATVAGDSSDKMIAAQEKAEKRKNKIAGILKNIKKDQYEGEITKEMAEEMSAEYESELLELENTIASLKAALKDAITPEGVYNYLQELLSFYGSDNDELTKMLFDKLIAKILVHDDRVEVTLIVSPFAYNKDNEADGQPYYQLSLITNRKEIAQR